jgi:hypothetical protein
MENSKKIATMTLENKYYPEGYHVRSLYWKRYKQSLPAKLPSHLTQIALGVALGDASLYRTKYAGAKLKIEQGYKHYAYVTELCNAFKDWTFYKEPYAYIGKTDPRTGQVKSYGFRTFVHPAFDFLWDSLMTSGKKTYVPGTLLQYLEPLGLCYWVADDGSLHKKSNDLILHTQGFSYEENLAMCQELNDKFSLHARVKSHKDRYWVIYFPTKDAAALHTLLADLPDSMKYKRPQLKG